MWSPVLSTYNTKHLVELETRGWNLNPNTKPWTFDSLTLGVVDWTAIHNVVLLHFFLPMLGNFLSLHCNKYCTKFVRSVKWTIIQAVISRAFFWGNADGQHWCTVATKLLLWLHSYLLGKKRFKSKVSFYVLLLSTLPSCLSRLCVILSRYAADNGKENRQFSYQYSFLAAYYLMMSTEAKHTMFPRGILTNKMISQCLTGTANNQHFGSSGNILD